MGHKIIYLLLILCLNGVLSDSCEMQTTCHECIRYASPCVWCPSENYSGVRCKTKTDNNDWCPVSVDNPNNTITTSEEKAFSSDSGTFTQIKPQKYELHLRPGQPLDFPFSFRGAKDYPVDLYFLFDASKTMTTVKNHTARQSKNIYETMLTMTKDVFLGMGTFIDKNTLPYTLNVTNKKAYSFRHRLNLTKDYTKFQETVDNIPVGENRDPQEGGLDALAQVIKCKDEIGWRTESRKILVFLTNGPYHSAGDGRSGGIFQPYDGECYTKNGIYTKELEMDYPSVSMINKMARENNVIVIFVVTMEVNSVYQSLASAITGSKMVQLNLEKDHFIVDTLKDIYKEITMKIKLNVDMVSGRFQNFEITFNPDCLGESDECIVGNKKEHNFTGTIKLLKYYDGDDKASVNVTIKGINEKLALDIHVIKDCDCESKPVNSAHCNYEILECGICKCGKERYGNKCACTRNSENKIVDDNTTCIAHGSSKLCSESGTCVCGACQCIDGYAGHFCECGVDKCPLNDKRVCGGHGECQCDQTCKCDREWSGDACECYKAEERCQGNNDLICSNRGKCNCDACICEPLATWDSRKEQDRYCTVKPCPECHGLQCKILTDCALCRLKEYEDCPACSFTQSEIVDELTKEVMNGTDWQICPKVRVEVGCYTDFAYKYGEEQYKVLLMLQRKKDCAESYYSMYILNLFKPE